MSAGGAVIVFLSALFLTESSKVKNARLQADAAGAD
jgi:hypothetical protein